MERMTTHSPRWGPLHFNVKMTMKWLKKNKIQLVKTRIKHPRQNQKKDQGWFFSQWICEGIFPTLEFLAGDMEYIKLEQSIM